jgi:hypothetical protein
MAHTQKLTDFKHISTALEVAQEHGLQVEVIYEALEHAKKYPELNNTTHMAVALSEWVK